MPTTPPHKNGSAVRARTIYLGRDARGREYILKTETPHDTVVVIDGHQRILRDDLDGLRVEHVMATVADEIGWDECRFGHWTADALPRRYA